MSERVFHDFYAPIDGTAFKFSMRCKDKLPNFLYALAPLAVEMGATRSSALYAQLDLVNHLLRDLPWAMLASQKRGNIGAILEAAEARRAEIYGPLTVFA
jgi:hypothetical protein